MKKITKGQHSKHSKPEAGTRNTGKNKSWESRPSAGSRHTGKNTQIPAEKK
jgi:hypothetical protein